MRSNRGSRRHGVGVGLRGGDLEGKNVLAEADGGALRRAVTIAGKDDVLLDVSATLLQSFTTGIQRVVRETVARWVADHPNARPVVWTVDESAPSRELTDLEQSRFERLYRRDPEPANRDRRRGGRHPVEQHLSSSQRCLTTVGRSVAMQ